MSLSKEAVALLKNNAEEVRVIVNEFIQGVNGWDSFVKLHTSPPVRFKDFHGNEVREGEDYFYINDGEFVTHMADVANKGSGKITTRTYFKFEPDAKDWIELNKPCLSVQDVLDWICADSGLKIIYKQQLLELIKAKKQQP